MDRARHVVFVLGSPEAPKRMLGGQCRFLVEQGYRVTVIASPGPALAAFSREEGVAVEAIKIEREIAVLCDLRSLWRLWRALRRLRPDVVDAGTPKAGLLGMLASFFAGISCRIYTLHGLRLETLRGIRRAVLWLCERFTTAVATEVICVSRSLRDQARAHGVLSQGRGAVLADGSANGVDLERFSPSPEPADSLVLGFVGRLTADKGVAELTEALRSLKVSYPDLRLLVVGDFEVGDPPPLRIREILERDPAVELAGFVDDPAPYYKRMHVVALPSHREGLPFALLEAAASGRPVVSSWATGCIDAVEHGKTGFLVPPGNAGDLARAIGRLLGDSNLRAEMGVAARKRVERLFARQRVWRAKAECIEEALNGAAMRRLPIQRSIKRMLDIVAASALLCLTAPICALCALAVRIGLGRPAFFVQQRPGLAGKPIRVVKFRTMNEGEGADAERLTPLGLMLRRWSLDELPQLWGVLKGDLSLVGPRPLLADYLPLYDERQRRRHFVKPGLTGWAQIHGRNMLDWRHRLELDVWYAENWNMIVDLRVLAATVGQVLLGHGVQAGEQPTPARFRGEPSAPL